MAVRYEIVEVNDPPATYIADLSTVINAILGDGGRVISHAYKPSNREAGALYSLIVEYQNA